MSKRIFATSLLVLIVLVAGGFCLVAGQNTSQNTAPNAGPNAAKKAGADEHTYVIRNSWYGFVTDTVTVKSIGTGSNSNRGDRFDLDILKRNLSVPGDAIRKNVAEKGGRYVLINADFIQRYIILEPADKVAAFAGKQVFVTGAITTHSILKGGEGGFYTIAVSSVEPRPIDSDWIY